MRKAQETPAEPASLEDVIEALSRVESRLAAIESRLESFAGSGPPALVPSAAVLVEASSELAAGDPAAIGEEAPVLPPPPASADWRELLAAMFRAALQPGDEVAFETLASLTHPRDLAAPRSLDNLKAFSWRKLRKTATRYLRDGDPGSFSIERTNPGAITGDVDVFKVYLHAREGAPAPVTLRRDPSAGGAWRIEQISL